MTNQHPIIPPPELVQQWAVEVYSQTADDDQRDLYIANRAAQYGADQELQACCEWLENQPQWMEDLRDARRPKPPSLKEQALEGLTRIESTNDFFSNQMKDLATIRRALNQLPDS